MRDQNACYQFYHINADTVSRRIFDANRKYFGPAFDTKEIRRDISYWLYTEFFSTSSSTKMPWEIGYAPTDASSPEASRFTCNHYIDYGMDAFGKGVSITNNICLRKLIDSSVYNYTAKINNENHQQRINKLKFLCEFDIDITYHSKSPLNNPLNNAKAEYYRETIVDTVYMFTMLAPSNFVYR